MTLEGGKGSSAPAPDPRLVEAQIKSMGIQDAAIQKILSQSDEMAPLQKEQTQFALDTQRQAWEQSQEDRDYALGRRDKLTGLQDTMVEDAHTFDTEAKREELAGQAAADVSQAYESSKRTQNAEMARMGINPADGKYGAASNALAAGEALAMATGKNSARTAARAEGRALTDRAQTALAGYPAMGMQTTGQGAGFGTAAQMAANNGLAGLNSGYGQAGGMAGQMGSNATSMWGAQANHQANMQSNESVGGLLGGLGGAAAGLAKLGVFSDRRLKADVERIGVDERTGLPLYEFAYTAEPGRRYVGVMADEVLERFPDAVLLDESGFMRVDYSALGIEFKEVK
ncbi:tail fiber domain-containing protein [Delftia sp. PE138]|uniref:tail fiber domain-containing protein n=1 Tax=Delftia sp. PE138 TaxID=1812483 RepID=UPI002016695A|nr:tail fiber domain-containing protein [Delftia sp. PE138]